MFPQVHHHLDKNLFFHEKLKIMKRINKKIREPSFPPPSSPPLLPLLIVENFVMVRSKNNNNIN
jgi:hypothetical protein